MGRLKSRVLQPRLAALDELEINMKEAIHALRSTETFVRSNGVTTNISKIHISTAVPSSNPTMRMCVHKTEL